MTVHVDAVLDAVAALKARVVELHNAAKSEPSVVRKFHLRELADRAERYAADFRAEAQRVKPMLRTMDTSTSRKRR